jgi:hypothetical protein
MERPGRSLPQWRGGADGRLQERVRAWSADHEIWASVAATGAVLAMLLAPPRQRKYVFAEVRMQSCQR